MKHHLEYEQFIDAPIEEVWTFFSDAKNLKVLTPDHMKMIVRSNLPKTQLFEGMRIVYTISPLFRIPVYWETEILKVVHQSYFIDIQRKGPFRSWKHKHTFIQKGEGVLMKDEIVYELPLGWLGELFHQPLVLNHLKALFQYRKEICLQIFNR
ncbi:SRPBCC family protein [Faecalibacter sp. LW9]|uniref:SRPBCC family protein n=1 Tax=Faecalibacter sp. LW9 TaxID=3103144 RepID=UPI002AFE1C3F|nr:SRPBCC family protein [Faecalibacter sp. LW9]